MNLINYFVVCCVCSSYSLPIDIYGYYWREFRGDTPNDAVKVGPDGSGKTIFIGQALHVSPHGKLVPGGIDPVTNKMNYAWSNQVYESNSKIKILCSPNPKDFGWIEVPFIDATENMNEDDFVVGGYDGDDPLYIGKINVNNQMVIGKVKIKKPHEGAAFAVNGQPLFLQGAFSILTFNNKSNSITYGKNYF